jgi:predicted dehydrogenase
MGRVWLERLRDHPSAEVVGLVDVSEAALTAAREVGDYGEGICFSELDEALGGVEADALVCVTPPEHHRACVVEAMRAGLDVITEKPMADDLASCLAILRASRATGRTCVVSQNYRYRPETWSMARLVESGRIGEVGQVKVDFYLGHDFGGGFRHTMEYPLLVDMAIHHFDLIRCVTGLNAVSVRGEAWNPPWSNYEGDCSSSLVFEMGNGARVVYNASWCAKGQFCGWDGNWQIEGSRGCVVYDQEGICLHEVPELYTVDGREAVEVRGPERLEQDFVLDDFISSVEGGRRPQTDVFDNVYSMAMVFAAVEAVRTGWRTPVTSARVEQAIEDTTEKEI